MKLRYALIGLLFLPVLLGSVSAAQMVSSKRLLTDGLSLFREAAATPDVQASHARYHEALQKFERLVDNRGVRNARIYYDIGNTYFRLGDIGRAILSFKRAELFNSGDPNIEQNLAYARSKRQDNLPANETSAVLRVLFFWHYDLGVEVQTLSFALLFGLVWVFLLVIRISGQGWLRWLAGTSAVMAALFLFSLTWRQVDLATRHEGVIVASSVTPRKGDALSYDPALNGALHSGTEFTLLSSRPEWFHIELTNGARAWIPTSSAMLVRPVNQS